MKTAKAGLKANDESHAASVLIVAVMHRVLNRNHNGGAEECFVDRQAVCRLIVFDKYYYRKH